MSNTTSLILRVAIVLGSVISVAWSVHYLNRTSSLMPDTDEEKQAILEPMPNPPEHHTEKVRGPLSVSIVSLNSSGGTLVLEATVHSQKPVQDVQAQWVLPSHMTLVSGHLSGSLGLVGPNSPKTVQVTVRSSLGNSGPIHFVAKGANGGARFSSVRQFSPAGMQPSPIHSPRLAF